MKRRESNIENIVFFFNDTATTEIYTLSLHDALPISRTSACSRRTSSPNMRRSTASRSAPFPTSWRRGSRATIGPRSEEHTSELQSRQYLVCRLLLEKKKTIHSYRYLPY